VEKLVVTCFKASPWHLPRGTEENYKRVCQNSKSLGWESVLGCTDCKARVLTMMFGEGRKDIPISNYHSETFYYQ
jgi:hypothetical protein